MRLFVAEETQEGIWQIGGYWSLEKRMKDIANMEAEWTTLLANFPDEAELQTLKGLAKKLRENAYALDRSLRSQPMHYYALLHGDCKAANIFLASLDGTDEVTQGGRVGDEEQVLKKSRKESMAGAIDWQWCGWGLGMQDVVYLISTSSSLQVLEKEEREKFVSKKYILSLRENLCQRLCDGPCKEGHAIDVLEQFSEDRLQLQFRVALCDYTRFLVGSMWGKVTPSSIEKVRLDRNVGMHKRNLNHLLWLARNSNLYLSEFERKVTGTHRKVAKALSLSLQLASMAGQIARDVTQEKTLGTVNKTGDDEKALDPQTKADRDSEQLILNVLSACLPDVEVIGEEGYEPNQADGEKQKSTLNEHLVAPWEVDLDDLAQSDTQGSGTDDEITVWIDPLDGTREYVEGTRECVTVLIGIAVNGQAVAGVINQPFIGAEGRTLWGGLGMGVWETYGTCWERATPLQRHQQSPQKEEERRLIVATTRSHPGPKVEEGLKKLPVDEVVRVGGAGGKVALILDGKVDAWIFPQKGMRRPLL